MLRLGSFLSFDTLVFNRLSRIRFGGEHNDIGGGSMRWRYRTRRGTVSILPVQGRWGLFYDDENLGSYHSPEAAADDAARGHTFTPSNGVDLGSIGIPYDLSDWDRF